MSKAGGEQAGAGAKNVAADVVPPQTRGVASTRAGDRSVEGRVFRLHLKPETPGERGLPKRAVPAVRLKHSGLEGDFNRYRHEEKHDDEAMAVLIMPREAIEQLNREGWPVKPGDLAENITTEGIAYGDFEIGQRFEVGRARVAITKPCTPCTFLYLLPYVGEARGPEFLRTMVDRRGWYARVEEEGDVRVGDAIRLSR